MRSVYRSVGALVIIGLSIISISGCSSGSGEKLYPVAGKVTLKGTPMATGMVTFIPDEAKGNKTKLSPVGKIGSDGAFTLTTDNRTGAPLGWYKVIVSTEIPGMGGGTTPDPKKPGLPSTSPSSVQFDPKYRDAMKTDLRCEVVASPAEGAYDVKLLK